MASIVIAIMAMVVIAAIVIPIVASGVGESRHRLFHRAS
jgi:hypothetical protein